MFNQTINQPEVFLNEDFIGVWDNVILDDFNDFKNASSKLSPKHATSPVEDISTPNIGSESNNLWNEN